MNRKNTFARLVLFIVLGLIIGGVLGECLGVLFGQLGELMNAGGYNNIVHDVFVAEWPFGFGFGFSDGKPEPLVLDLYMIKLAFGFSFKINLASVIGMVVGIYIMKWSGER